MTAAFEPSRVQRRALAALATYTTLTLGFMAELKVGTRRQLGAELATLERKGWIGSTTQAPLVSGVKRLPFLFWLTPRGAQAFAALPEGFEARGASMTLDTMREIEHRLGIVAVHMGLRLWAAETGLSVPWFVSDFDPRASMLHKATTMTFGGLGRFQPDGIGAVETAPGETRLVVLEVERGGAQGRLQTFRRKLPYLRELCERHLIEREYQSRFGVRFLVVFATANMRERALRLWPEPEAAVWQRFFVKDLAELKPDFNGGWWKPGRVRGPLFPL